MKPSRAWKSFKRDDDSISLKLSELAPIVLAILPYPAFKVSDAMHIKQRDKAFRLAYKRSGTKPTSTSPHLSLMFLGFVQ